YTATATLTGTHKANYTITSGATTTFDIKRAPNTVTITATSGWTFGSKPATESGVVQASALFGAVNVTYYTDQGCTSEIAFAEINNAGTYYVKVTSTGDGANYDGDTKTASFTVEKASNVITFTPGYPAGWTYGDKPETEADVVQATAQFGGTITFKYYTDQGCTSEIAFGDIVNAGTYYIMATSAETDNYGETSATSQFVVAQATLTVTADSVTVIYGDPVPTFTYTCEGFVNGDNESVLKGSLTSNYTQGTNANRRCDILIGTLSATNYEITYTKSSFTVKQREISLTKTLLEYSYGEEGATAIIANAKSNVNGIYNSDNAVSISYTTDASNYISTATISVGNTYLIEYEINNTNYVWKEGSSTSCYYKYKTANIGGTYHTIEDAIKKGGHIILAGGHTSFTALSGYYTGDCYTLRSGSSIFVPHKADAKYEGISSSGNVYDLGGASGGVYSVLFIPDGITLTINGSLGIGGDIKSAGAITKRGVVMNEGTIHVRNQLHSIGYLKSKTGNGKIYVYDGATVLDIFTSYDYKGGRNTYGICDDIFPFNAYTLHNISCETIINKGATYTAKFYASLTGVEVDENLVIIGDGGLFAINSGSIKKSTSNPDNTNTWNTTQINGLTAFDGSNQIKGQKDIITICGEVTDNSIKITKYYEILGVQLGGINIVTGPDYPLPIAYMDIFVGDETTSGNLTLDAVSYNFLPGTKLVVSKNSTLTVYSNIKLYFYTDDQCEADFYTNYSYTDGNGSGQKNYSFWQSYCLDHDDATLEVNGTATINGYIGGTVTTNDPSGVLTIANRTVTVKYLESLTYSDSSTKSDFSTDTNTLYVIGPVVNDNLGTSYSITDLDATTYKSTGSAWYTGNYTLTYNLNYTGSVDETKQKDQGTALNSEDLSELPTRTGYKFDGWYLEEAYTTPANTTTLYYGNVTLYAKWTANTYTVFFNPNGGTVYKTSKTVTYDSPYGDTTEALPIPAREGYTFNGWWTTANGGDLISQDTIVKITSAQTLYAHWQANEYDVTFNYNFGDNPTVSTYKITYNTTYSTVMPNVEVPDGYEFLGWWTAAEGGTQVNANDVYTLTTDQTLYAHWNELTDHVLVTYLDNNGNQLATGVKTGLGTAYSYNYLVPGYVVSWLDESGNAAVPLDATVGSTVTVTATLTPITYTVVYDTGAGTAVSNATVTYGTTFTLPSSTRAGYTLTWLVNGEDKAVGAEVSNLTTTANATVTITADWTPITYTIAFNRNNGTGSMGDQQFTYDVVQMLSANMFERTGYTFAGWATSADGDVVYLDKASVNNLTTTANQTITLYAVWNVNSYIVTFNCYNETIQIEATFGSTYASWITPDTPSGYTFDGWYNDDKYTTKLTEITTASDHNVYAKYVRTITLDANGGSLSPSTYTHVYNTTITITDVISPDRTGYSCPGFYSAATGGTPYTTFTNDTPSTLFAQWELVSYTVSVVSTNATVTVNGTTVNNGGSISITYGSQVTVSVTYSKSNRSLTITGTDGTTYESPFNMPAQNVTIKASSSSVCIAAGTLITMADGTTKKVEDLVAGDIVLVFNHYKGEYEFMPVIYNVHDYEDWAYYDILYLYFDDGTVIKTHLSHCFLDMSSMRYEEISINNVSDYIGHSFYAADFDGTTYTPRTIKLTSFKVVNEYTGVYGPTTYGNLNCFAEGLLNIPSDNDPFINIFIMNTDLKYDEELMAQDIATYGLYTYEDFRPYISEDIYNAYNGQYIKVAVGKGYTTFERVLELIDLYLSDMGYGDQIPTDNGASNIPVADTVVDALPPSTASGDKDGLDSD
ncbi:MAG: InlB B-repeat-containing protein, partial [Clostridia bacterium]|nr:InlB B-repeat-containing protein [Clostridia bacterium]